MDVTRRICAELGGDYIEGIGCEVDNLQVRVEAKAGSKTVHFYRVTGGYYEYVSAKLRTVKTLVMRIARPRETEFEIDEDEFEMMLRYGRRVRFRVYRVPEKVIIEIGRV